MPIPKGTIPAKILEARALGLEKQEVVRKLAAELGTRRDVISEAWKRMERDGRLSKVPSGVGQPISRKEYLLRHDAPTRTREAIRAAVKTLDNDTILTDSQFRLHRCQNVPTSHWKFVREEPEFLQYQWSQGGTVMWGSPDTKQWAMENCAGAKEVQ